MNESAKTNSIRPPSFAKTFLAGKVIDIGAGEDLVCAWAERFDVQDGDANEIALYRQAASYDTVHSSHCLEHMSDAPKAVSDWWSLVKPGGYLIVVVPDEDLYEQGHWPSIFNSDHKSTFRLGKQNSWSPVSWDIEKLICSLPKSEIIECCIQDQRYDHTLKQSYPPKKRRPFRGYSRLKQFISSTALNKFLPKHFFTNFECRRFGFPIDQTMGDALAQIQVIARKRPHSL
jgi:SAM-dependent methyltransferase